MTRPAAGGELLYVLLDEDGQIINGPASYDEIQRLAMRAPASADWRVAPHEDGAG